MRISANQSGSGEEMLSGPFEKVGVGSDLCEGDAGARGASRAGGESSQGRSDEDVTGHTSKSPSNRRDLPPLDGVDDPSLLGIDRLSVSFKVEDFDANPDHWDSYSVRHVQKAPSPWLTYEELHPFDGSFVGTMMESHGRNFEFVNGAKVFAGVLSFVSGSRTSTIGKLEFNPARFADPSGFRLATVAESLSALVEVVGGVDVSLVPMFADELKSYKIKRIDVGKIPLN